MSEPSEELVERVAKAIWGADDLSMDDTWEDCACKGMVREQARAAITAMQSEPPLASVVGVKSQASDSAHEAAGIPVYRLKDATDQFVRK